MTVRTMRPRDPVAVAPSHVSQLTCMQIAGIDPRRYLDLLAAHPECPRASVGRLRVVVIEDLRGLLSRLASTSADVEHEDDSGDEDAPMTADTILARVGMRRSA